MSYFKLKFLRKSEHKELEDKAFKEGEYNLVLKYAAEARRVGDLFCEIGLDSGIGTHYILRELKNPVTHVMIDPYGSIPYVWGEGKIATHDDYSNSIRNDTLQELFKMYGSSHNLIFLNLTDEEFFKRFSDGVPVYSEHNQTIKNEYAFVMIDGPHDYNSCFSEFEFFKNRILKDGIIMFDDYNLYEHFPKLDDHIKNNGFEFAERGGWAKAIYRKK